MPSKEKPEPKEKDYELYAQELLELLFSQAPETKELDEMCATEFGLTASQRVLKYIGITLIGGHHLNVLAGYEFLNTGAAKDASPYVGVCPQCSNVFNRKYPGQRCCSNECGEKYFPKVEPKVPEYGDMFEKALEEQAAAILQAEIVPELEPRPAALPTSPAIR